MANESSPAVRIRRPRCGTRLPGKNCSPLRATGSGSSPRFFLRTAKVLPPAARTGLRRYGKPLPRTRLQNGRKRNEERRAIRAEPVLRRSPKYLRKSRYFPKKNILQAMTEQHLALV